MQTAECRERTDAVKTVSPYLPSVTGVKSSMLCASMTCRRIQKSAAGGWYELSCSSGSEVTTQAPVKTGGMIRLQIRDLKLEFPAGTDPDILIRISRELMRI